MHKKPDFERPCSCSICGSKTEERSYGRHRRLGTPSAPWHPADAGREDAHHVRREHRAMRAKEGMVDDTDRPLALHAAMRLPAKVIIGECWARDGLQSESEYIPTDLKVEVITAMVEAGCRKLEATSFAHPGYLPQFRDAEEVLRRIPRRPGVSYRGVCTTMRAIERARASRDAGYGVDEVAMVISASEAHNMANVRMNHRDNRALLEKMARAALDAGHQVFGWVLTSFGCPIAGDVPPDEVLALGRWWRDIGASYIGFGDTTGVANPLQVEKFFTGVLAAGFTRHEVVVHFHDTRGWGIANTLQALRLGFYLVDTSLGAIGGQPKTGAALYQEGDTGNTCTEDLVGLLEEMGVDTGLDVDKIVRLGRRVEQIIGRRLRSDFIHAGPVLHAARRDNTRASEIASAI